MTFEEDLSVALSAAEWEIMKVFWQRGPLAARDVYAALPRDRAWAYKTVKTLLARLVAKQALTYEQVGNSYLYRAAVDRERMTRREVRGILQRLADTAFSPVLAQFIDEADLNDAEIKQLKRRLDEKRKQAASSAVPKAAVRPKRRKDGPS
jgi:BlaI family transcriptional regulator, penicillinase repressor